MVLFVSIEEEKEEKDETADDGARGAWSLVFRRVFRVVFSSWFGVGCTLFMYSFFGSNNRFVFMHLYWPTKLAEGSPKL